MGGGGWGGATVSTKSAESQSELLQQLSEVGGLGELSVDPGQLVKDRTVQGHTGNLPLCTAAAVPADLQKHTHTYTLDEGSGTTEAVMKFTLYIFT